MDLFNMFRRDNAIHCFKRDWRRTWEITREELAMHAKYLLFGFIFEDVDSSFIFVSCPKKPSDRRRFENQEFPKLFPHGCNIEGLFHNHWMIRIGSLEMDFQEDVVGNIRFGSDDQLEEDVNMLGIICLRSIHKHVRIDCEELKCNWLVLRQI